MSAGKKRLLVDQQQQQKQQHRLSRKLTVDTREPYVSIRPVIKKADKEAAYTLSEAYRDDPTLRWITGSIKDEKKRLDFYQDVFKQLIRTAAHVSRELAVQVNGCKGVLVWSEGDNQCLTIHNALGKRGLFSSPGGMSALRAAMTHHRNFSKAKKHAMSGRPHVVINYLGVLASDRRTSLGTSLIKYVLQKADSAQMPVFAEVWGEQNLNWLTRLGFQVYTETRLCSDPSIPSSYYVVREPQLAPDTPLSPTTPSNNLQLEPPREEPVSEEK